jgi:hypothetical protein
VIDLGAARAAKIEHDSTSLKCTSAIIASIEQVYAQLTTGQQPLAKIVGKLGFLDWVEKR